MDRFGGDVSPQTLAGMLLGSVSSDALSPFPVVRSALSEGRAADEHRCMANDTMKPIRHSLRVFNKHVLNPLMMNMAGAQALVCGGDSPHRAPVG
jgi:hypothetical protein